MLKQRGHTPVIFEKTGELGGLYITASAMSFKEADKALLRWYERELKKNDIEVRFHMEINAPATLRREFDEIIVCTGSHPKTLPVKGFNKTINFTLCVVTIKSDYVTKLFKVCFYTLSSISRNPNVFSICILTEVYITCICTCWEVCLCSYRTLEVNT